MPIYEYQCEKCGKHLEALQRVSEPPLTTCPDCSGELKKLLSAPAFQFKGSGWYVTDYAGKSGGGKDDKKDDKKTEGGDKKEAGGESKADDKPAKKKSTSES